MGDIDQVGAPQALSEHDYYQAYARVCVLRMLARTELSHAAQSKMDTLFDRLGMEVPCKALDKPEWRAWWEGKCREAESSLPERQGVLFRNVDMLADEAGLTVPERELLAFRVLYTHIELIEFFCDNYMGVITDSCLVRWLSVALGITEERMAAALKPGAKVFAAGLLSRDPASTIFLKKIGLPAGLANNLLRPASDIDELLDFALNRAPPPTLCLEDYGHHAKDIDILGRFLRSAAAQRLRGVNILVHGIPGIGKTEFVRALAAASGLCLYEVNMRERVTGLALSPRERQRAYMIDQQLLASRGNVALLFDEVEDIFPVLRERTDESQIIGGDKAWLNHLLETNNVPAFWVANHIHHLDRACLRRFDYVLGMRNPPRVARGRLLNHLLDGMGVSAHWTEQQAANDALTPALAARAARLIKTSGISNGADTESCFNRVVEGSLAAMGGTARAMNYRLPQEYRIDFVNTSIAPQAIANGLKRHFRGRLLFHGAPGTGKTALAHYLARELGIRLLVKRASDIQSMYVGGTEKNIASMFRDAAGEGSMLLLDEADSFLYDRSGAKHTWEVSCVNELLTQMECFEGIFICATNFIESLDQASLRRFGLKVRFDYLTNAQRWEMFRAILDEQGADPCGETETARLRRALDALTNLTPGDFAAACEHQLLAGDAPSAEGLIQALREESEIKPDGHKRLIGFVA